VTETSRAGLQSAFDRATAVRAAGPGRWLATCDTSWSTPRGPNGGYLAAIVLRALLAEVADPAREPRSLTLHYLRSPTDGELVVDVEVERTGRSLTSLSARVSQGGRVCILALAALAVERESVVDYAASPPAVPPPEAIEPTPLRDPAPAIARRFEVRPALGAAPFSGSGEALTGGWLRFAEPRRLDAVALAMYADAWLPAPFTRLTAPVGAPTIDLTVHFRAPAAAAAVGAGEPVLAVFRSSTSGGGFFEEDGELWSRDGTLLAHSRQLALLTARAAGIADRRPVVG
jgi:acyl-CoA thioesterase